jgi:hypothetical protein
MENNISTAGDGAQNLNEAAAIVTTATRNCCGKCKQKDELVKQCAVKDGSNTKHTGIGTIIKQ